MLNWSKATVVYSATTVVCAVITVAYSGSTVVCCRITTVGIGYTGHVMWKHHEHNNDPHKIHLESTLHYYGVHMDSTWNPHENIIHVKFIWIAH